MDDFAAKTRVQQISLGWSRERSTRSNRRSGCCQRWRRPSCSTRQGAVKIVTGSPGGPTIITTVAQMISNVVDFDMDIGAATAAPRLHHQHLPDQLHYERDGLRPEVVAGIRGLGHPIQARPGYQGDTQSILLLPDGTRHRVLPIPGVAGPLLACGKRFRACNNPPTAHRPAWRFALQAKAAIIVRSAWHKRLAEHGLCT